MLLSLNRLELRVTPESLGCGLLLPQAYVWGGKKENKKKLIPVMTLPTTNRWIHYQRKDGERKNEPAASCHIPHLTPLVLLNQVQRMHWSITPLQVEDLRTTGYIPIKLLSLVTAPVYKLPGAPVQYWYLGCFRNSEKSSILFKVFGFYLLLCPSLLQLVGQKTLQLCQSAIFYLPLFVSVTCDGSWLFICVWCIK